MFLYVFGDLLLFWHASLDESKDQYRLLGENVAKLRTDLMKEQLTTFRSQLEDFARKHKVSLSLSQCVFVDIFVEISINMN